MAKTGGLQTNPFVGLPKSTQEVLLRLCLIHRAAPWRLPNLRRADIAKEVGMNRMNLHRHVTKLLDAGLLETVDHPDTRYTPIRLAFEPNDDVLYSSEVSAVWWRLIREKPIHETKHEEVRFLRSLGALLIKEARDEN